LGQGGVAEELEGEGRLAEEVGGGLPEEVEGDLAAEGEDEEAKRVAKGFRPPNMPGAEKVEPLFCCG